MGRPGTHLGRVWDAFGTCENKDARHHVTPGPTEKETQWKLNLVTKAFLADAAMKSPSGFERRIRARRKREREKERKRGRRIDSTCHYETCIDVESFPADVLPLSFAKVSKPHYNCF